MVARRCQLSERDMDVGRQLILLLAGLALLTSAQSGSAQITLPGDVKKTCPDKNFDHWLDDAGGADSPPTPLLFDLKDPKNLNCEFYKIAERMFLWITSPAKDHGEGKYYVFDTPLFYEVSPPDRQNERILTINALNAIKRASISISQTDKVGDSIGIDGGGRVWKFAKSQSIARPARFPLRGQVSINGVQFAVDRTDRARRLIRIQEGEQSPVLMTKSNGLVYYTIEVNDVYALFLSNVKPPLKSITQTHFPICQCELDKIENEIGAPLSVPGISTIALKLAWVEADRVEEPDDYILTLAKIPTYKEQDATHWNETGWKEAKLALVGMHIAFATLKNEALIWTTFEHVRNAPNVPYQYQDTGGLTCSYPRSPNDKCGALPSAKKDSVSGQACGDGENDRRMHLNGRNIEAYPGKTIGPTNVVRCAPWGSNAQSGVENTKIISINSSVHRQLPMDDIRRNYVMIGTIWDETGMGGGSPEGTKAVANTTMETFYQKNENNGCFMCHQGKVAGGGRPEKMLGDGHGGGVSHIWDATKPLALRPPAGRPTR
jgi:hypothetical protein